MNKNKKQYDIFYQILLISVALLFAVSGSVSHLYAQPQKIPILFYSCEIDINNFIFLKMEFDSYLSKKGPYEFLPFTDREVFEKQIRKTKKCLIIVSGWHYSQIYKKYSLSPVMAGVRKGKTHQKRVLVADTLSDLESVQKGQIASATSFEHTIDALVPIFKNRFEPSGILKVPRDIDALMSVGIGISQSALATEGSLEKLHNIYPSLFKRMRILAACSPSWLLIVSVKKEFRKDLEKIIEILANMPGDPSGKNKIKMLGLDGWEKNEDMDRFRAGGL